MSVHINAKKGDFAKVLLMPGDPVRATWIAHTFLKDYKEVCDVRGMLGYTGYTKNGKRISVMASGMGQPTIGIYSYELFSEFNVETIIRVGTCGAFQKNINTKDIIIAQNASTDFNWMADFDLQGGTYSAGATYEVLEAAVHESKKSKAKVHVGNIFSEGRFYHFTEKNKEPWWKPWQKIGVLGCEMESYALYCNAALLHKKALGMFTVSDHFQKPGILSSDERAKGLKNMIEIAIRVAEKFA